MPIKWTPEVDQVLLLKILETQDIRVDVGRVSANWPKTMEQPTPRAISERLVKLRQTCKAAGSTAGFAISPGKKTSTPRTPKTPNTPKTPASGGIRKRGASNTGTGRAKQIQKSVSMVNLEDSDGIKTEAPDYGVTTPTGPDSPGAESANDPSPSRMTTRGNRFKYDQEGLSEEDSDLSTFEPNKVKKEAEDMFGDLDDVDDNDL